MKPIVDSEDLINTYSNERQIQALQHTKVIKLKGLLSARKAAMRLNVPFTRVSDWFYAKNKPWAIRAIKKAKNNGWIPLFPSPELAYLVGYNTGDGHVAKDLHYIRFFNKHKEILDHIGKELKEIFNLPLDLESSIKFKESEYWLSISDAALTRIFHAAGAPKGNKTEVLFLVPLWVLRPEIYGCSPQISIKIQRRYLQGLNDAELRKPYLNSENWIAGHLNLQMYKVKKLQTAHLKFLRQICSLYSKFNIKTKLTKPKYDKNKFVGEFEITSNLPNLLRFVMNVGFRFHQERLNVCNVYLEKSRTYLKRIEAYEKAMKILKTQRISYSKVASMINVDPETVRQWIVNNRHPRFFKFKEELKRYVSIINSKSEIPRSDLNG